jgi:hypothetical protein
VVKGFYGGLVVVSFGTTINPQYLHLVPRFLHRAHPHSERGDRKGFVMQKTPYKNVSFKGSTVQFIIFCMGNEEFSITYFGVRMGSNVQCSLEHILGSVHLAHSAISQVRLWKQERLTRRPRPTPETHIRCPRSSRLESKGTPTGKIPR